MAFWGVYLKPNEPYTLQYNDDNVVPKRLRITQATLGDATRNSPARSIVRCWVGDKPAIAICSLSIRELTCCQLELEFEESHDVIFSVMGPRGVHLAGYLITPVYQHTNDPNRKEKETVEIGGCSDHDLPDDFNKRGSVKESTDAQNTDIEHCDKNMKDGKRLLKCSRDKNNEGKIISPPCQKIGKDVNEDTNLCTYEKYVNRHHSSCDENHEKTVAVKTHSVFGRFLEEKRDAIEKKKKKKNKRKRKRIPITPEATGSEDVTDMWDEKPGSHSQIIEDNGILRENNFKTSSPVRSHYKAKERKKKHKRKHTLDYDNKHHSMGHTDEVARSAIIRDNINCENQRDDSCGEVKSREQKRKITKIVFKKKTVGR